MHLIYSFKIQNFSIFVYFSKISIHQNCYNISVDIDGVLDISVFRERLNLQMKDIESW